MTKLIPPADCDANSATQNFRSCLATNCASECNVSMSTSSASSTAATAGAGGDDSSAVGVGGGDAGVGGADAGTTTTTGNGAGGSSQGKVIVQSGCSMQRLPDHGPSRRSRSHHMWAALAMGIALMRRRRSKN